MNRVARHEAEKRANQIRSFIAEGKSQEEAEASLATQERREQVVSWLHAFLFEEEYDSMSDSHADAKDRARGVNPMDSDYQSQIAGKRAALKVPPLNAAGNATGTESRELCEKLIAEIASRL